jgi:hypothetical protein
VDVNEWIGYILRTTHLLVHVHQKKIIAVEIAAIFASVNGPEPTNACLCKLLVIYDV